MPVGIPVSALPVAPSFTRGDVLVGDHGSTTAKFGLDVVFNQTRTINNGETASMPINPWSLTGYHQNTDGTPDQQPWNGVYSAIYAGNGGVAAIGTVIASTFLAVVRGSGSASNEQGCIFAGVRQDIGTGYTQTTGPTGRVWMADFNVHGAIATQPNQLNGVTQFINNYYNGSPSANPSGAIWVVTKPGAGGGADSLHTAATTYAVDVGIGIVGAASGTGAGFTKGLQIGGFGSGWMESGTSKIGTAIHLTDYVSFGIRLAAKHSSAAASVPAFTVANGHGRVGVGTETPTAALDVVATDDLTPTVQITQVVSQTANALQIFNSGSGIVAAIGPNGNVWSGGGTAAFPNYSHWNDNDSGLFLDTGNAIGLATGGTSRLYMTNNGVQLFNGVTMDLGAGVGVIGIHNAATVPTTNATSGGVLYVESGALKYRGSSGTITTLGVA